MKLFSQKVVMLAVLLLSVSWVLWGQNSETAVLIDESFENGIPKDWTQEYVTGKLDWVLDTKSDFPNGTREGDGKRIAFRNTTGQTQGWSTKLVTPVLDLSLSKISNPILIVTHAQEKMTGDFDRLTIWFKTAADGDWKLLRRYDKYISFWQTDTIKLEQPGAYYQLAFEGSDNYGRGVVIDNVIVMPNPSCMQPSGVELWNVSNTTAQLFWKAGNNAKGFNIKVDTVPMTRAQLEADEPASVIDMHIEGSNSICNLEDLENNKTYYFYVQAECPFEKSQWSDGFKFRTIALVELPFRETFDTLSTGYASRNPRWVFGSEYEQLPFNNTDMDTEELADFSPDGTVSLFFGEEYWGSAHGIEPGKYMYVASPRLVVDDLSKVQVSFYASFYDMGGASYVRMSKIYIGGMTNPSDHNTFVVVDSVELNSKISMEKVTVSFIGHDNVKDCKHIAFYSDFDAHNFIAIDDVNVWIPDKCPEPANVNPMVVSATDLWVTWNKSNADHGNVVVSKTEIEDFSALPAGAVKLSSTSANDTVKFTVEEWTEYYVYVQNVAADGSLSNWSEAKWVRMPQSRTLSADFAFETAPEGEGTYETDPYKWSDNYMPIGIQGIWNLSGGTPYVQKTEGAVVASSKYEMFMGVYNYPGYSYTVFPAIDALNGCRVAFWAHTTSSSGTYYGGVEVGVMTVANDIRTFVPVDTIDLFTTEWGRYMVDLDKYKGNGKFVAFRAVYNQQFGRNVVIFDNVSIDMIPECSVVQNVTIVPDETSAEITWDAMTAAQSWEVKVSAEKLDYNELDNAPAEKLLPVAVTGEKAVVSGLAPRKSVYYAWIRPVCDGNTYGDWSAPYRFESNCLAHEPLPFVLDGEGYPSFDNYNATELPIPCVDFGYTGSGRNLSPILDSYKKKNGKYSFNMESDNGDSWIALPDFDENRQIQDVQVSFAMYSYNLTDTLQVGVMEDPADLNTFTLVKQFTVERKSEWCDFVCQFDNYTGNGRHIALLVREAQESEVYIDTITIDAKSPCLRVLKPKALDVTSNTATLAWENSGNETEWYLVVSTRTYSADDLKQIFEGTYEGEGVVFSDYVAQNPYQVKNLTSDTPYFFYVRSACDKANNVYGDWVTVPGEFRTRCDAIVPDETKYDFESSGTGVPACWSGTGTVYKGGSSSTTPAAHSGNYVVQIRDRYYLHTNNISCDDINEVQISFWATTRRDAVSAVPLEIGVLYNPNDLASYTAVDTVWLSTKWQYYTVKFDSYEGDAYGHRGKYIMFSNRQLPGANYCYIDDVSIDRKPECAPADVVIDNIGEAGLDVIFSGGKAPYSYVVTTENVDPNQFNPEESDIKTSSNGNCQITGLTPLTEYYLYVSSSCTDGKYLWSAPVRFKTTCVSVWPLPYYENFNSYEQSESSNTGLDVFSPDCWTSEFAGGRRLPTIFRGESRADGNCLLLDFYSGNSAKCYSVLPKVDKPVNECQIEFTMLDTYWSRSAQARVVIGVVEDITRMAESFVGLDTITKNSQYFLKNKVKLDKYVGNGGNIAILSYIDGDAFEYRVYLDDIVIRHTPPCPMPFDPKVTAYDDSSITFEFDAEDASSWEMKYGEAGFDKETVAATPLAVARYTITGLSPEKRYDIYVRALCPDVPDMTEGEWVMFSGRTSAPAVKDYPLNDDMKDNPDNWKPAEETTATNQWYIAENKEIDGETGTMLYISNDGGTTSDYSYNENSASIHRVMKFDIGKYVFDFKYNVTGAERWGDPRDYLSILIMPELYTISAEPDYWGDEIVYVCDEYGGKYDVTRTIPGNCTEIGKYCLSDGWKEASKELSIAPGKEGLYKIVFLWKLYGSSSPSKTSPAAAIKDFTVSYIGCIAPVDVKCSAIGSTTAELAWTSNARVEYTDFDVYVTKDIELTTPPDNDADDAQMICHAEQTGTTLSLTGLTENTPYKAFVRLKCGEGEYSAWSDASPVFRTDCGAATVGRVYGFEPEEGHLAYYEEYDDWYNLYIPECFVNGNKGENEPASMPYVYNGGARTGEWSLHVGKTNGAYLVMPNVEGDKSNLQLTFWMRCFTVDGKTNRVGGRGNHPLKSDRANALRIGSVTDMHDISTFEEVRLCDYPYDMTYIDWNVTMDTDPNGQNYWVKFNVPLKDMKGDYITFLSENFTEPFTNVYIDDVKIEPLNAKAAPYELLVKNITDTEARVELKFDAGSAWTVEVAEDRAFTKELKTVPATAAGADLSGLKPATVYYARAIQSGVDGAEYSPVVYFSTAYAVSFNENFDEAMDIPANWISGESKVTPDMMFDGTGKITNGDGYKWNAGNDTISSHTRALHFSDDDGYWLVTPPIVMSNEGDRAHMMYDFGITVDQFKWEVPSPDVMNGTGSKFAILVSDDAGLTWKKENSVIWTNNADELKEGGVYKAFTSLPGGLFHHMKLDMTKYRGKTVKVAFYSYVETQVMFHLDNIHINNVKDEAINDYICELDDYNEHGFHILDTELKEGINTRVREVYMTNDQPDTIYNLTLDRSTMVIERYEASVCESALPYTDKNGFVLEQGGTSRKKVQEGNCYTIKEVTLTVNPTIRVNVFDTICQGAEIVWNGMKLDRTGSTDFTTESKATGCDSIVTMNLRVLGALQGVDTVVVCHGETYEFGSLGELSVSGDYEDNIPNGDCDSIVKLHLVVRPVIDTVINDVMCPGEVYTKNGYNLDRPGTFPKKVVSPYGGCDSTVTLNLVQLVPDGVAEFTLTIGEDQLPFTFFSKTFDKSYKPGTYTEDVVASSENCSGTIRLTLIIENKSALPEYEKDNRELRITPNPVKVGGDVKLDIDLTAEERNGLVVDIYNAAGVHVKNMKPGTVGDIVVSCYFSPGVYVVRMTTGTGSMYQGKILIQ